MRRVDGWMSNILHISSVQVVARGILKITWDDNYEGFVDLRSIIARGKVFTPLQNPDYFRTVFLQRYGHSIYWGEEDNEEVDFGCDRLREMAEEQATSNPIAGRDHKSLKG
jgi:Protein of unknown function (DUF2442)